MHIVLTAEYVRISLCVVIQRILLLYQIVCRAARCAAQYVER
jgi:hypothetical protein